MEPGKEAGSDEKANRIYRILLHLFCYYRIIYATQNVLLIKHAYMI